MEFAAPQTEWMGEDTAGYRTDHRLLVRVGGVPVLVTVYAAGRPYDATVRSWRYLGPDTRGAKVGAKLDLGEAIPGAYRADVNGKGWVVTPSGSWLLASSLTPRLRVKG